MTAASWVELAACRGKPTAWWFPERGDRFTANVAKAVCAGCPSRRECLDSALAEEQSFGAYGIRGGVSADTRMRMSRRAAGTPRVQPPAPAIPGPLFRLRHYDPTPTSQTMTRAEVTAARSA